MPDEGATPAAIATRLAPLQLVFLTVAAQAIVLWGLLGDSGWAEVVRTGLGGWVDPNLPAGALVFLLSVVPFVFIRGRLRPRHIGLDTGKLARGVVVTAVLFVLLQLGLAAAALVDDGALRLARHWSHPRAPAAPLAFLFAMLVVMTGLEEATYRGFVLPQLWLRLRGSPRVRTWGAVLGSAVLFSAVHVPNRHLLHGLSGVAMAPNLAVLVMAGIFYAVVYLRTANLWVTGGAHALLNAPTPIVEPVLSPAVVLVPIVAVMLVVWPLLPGSGRRGIRGGTEIRVAAP